jgi:hypothetical protein
MDIKLGGRVEYWFVALEDGRTVRRGVVVAIYDGAMGIREDFKDWPDLVLKSDVIRKVG